MTRNDVNFSVLVKLAVQEYMEKEITDFDALDDSEISVSAKAVRKFNNRLLIQKIREAKILLYTKRIAVAVMVVVTVTFAGAMCIQPVRAAFWDAVITWCERYLIVQLAEDEAEEYPQKIEKRMLPAYLPEGWVLEVYVEDETGGMYDLIGPEGEYIGYDQKVFYPDSPTLYDNTDCSVSEITIRDDISACLLTYGDGRFTLSWVDEYEFHLQATPMPLEELLRIAESIQ